MAAPLFWFAFHLLLKRFQGPCNYYDAFSYYDALSNVNKQTFLTEIWKLVHTFYKGVFLSVAYPVVCFQLTITSKSATSFVEFLCLFINCFISSIMWTKESVQVVLKVRVTNFHTRKLAKILLLRLR